MSKALVTGATGFLGAEVARRLAAAGLSVRTTAIAPHPSLPLPDFRVADLRDETSLAEIVRGVQCVVHAAGLAHQFRSYPGIERDFFSINAGATEQLARAAAHAGVETFVLISSVSVYGKHDMQLVDETCPCRPEGPYAQSKHHAEQLATQIAQASGMRLVILRLATLYGEGDPGNVARLFRAIDRQRFVWIGTGSNTKSLLHRDDAARACVAAATGAGEGVRTYDVSAPPCTVREIVGAIAQSLSRRVPRWHIPAGAALKLSQVASAVTLGRTRIGSLPNTLRKWLADDAYSGERFRTAYGFRTEVSLEEGIRREATWYRADRRRPMPQRSGHS